MRRKPEAFATLAAWVASRHSQSDAALELGISESYLSQLLTGKRGQRMSLKRAREIAEKANIPIDSLLTNRAA